MPRRRRIGFRESFRQAAKADPGGGDAGMWAALVAGLWLWIRGVPEASEGEESEGA
jgi:hypothetical protein